MIERIRKHSDAVVGLVFLLFSGLMFVKTMEIKNVQSRFMPFFALAVIVIASLNLVIKALVLHRSPNARLVHSRRELLIWGLYVGAAFLMRWIGFYPAALVFTFVCTLLQAEKISGRTVWSALAFSLGLMVVIYLVFSLGVRMSLPTGTLFT